MDALPLDATIHFTQLTLGADGSPASASAISFAVFKDDIDAPILDALAMTERSGETGNYKGSIDLTAANGFTVGGCYTVIVSATVSAISSQVRNMQFRLGPAEAAPGIPKVDIGRVRGQDLQGDGSAGNPWRPV